MDVITEQQPLSVHSCSIRNDVPHMVNTFNLEHLWKQQWCLEVPFIFNVQQDCSEMDSVGTVIVVRSTRICVGTYILHAEYYICMYTYSCSCMDTNVD